MVDNDVAAFALNVSGANSEFCQRVPPRVAIFCDFDFVGDSDKLILGHKDQRIQKYFVDIYGALSDPSAELNNKIIIKVATLALKCVTIVYFSKFMKASAETKGNQLISEKATKKLYHCVKLTLWILRLHVQLFRFVGY